MRRPFSLRLPAIVTCFLFILHDSSSLTSRASQRAEPTTARPPEENDNVVTVGVRVTDNKKKTISGLNQSEFAVFEDGKPQSISFFYS